MLPVFLTEYGYGLLDRFDRFTAEGRERQAEWYREVLPAITDGTITGAMAFVFMPWISPVSVGNEFGLLASMPEALEQGSQSLNLESLKVAEKALSDPITLKRSGTKTASLSDARPSGSRPSDLGTLRLLDSTGLSPVVIDFIAGKDTQSVKRYNGHLLGRITNTASSPHASASESDGTLRPADAQPLDLRSKATSSGEFTLVFYNFSDNPTTGTLRLSLESGTVTTYTPPPPLPPASKSPTDIKILGPSDLETREAPRASPPLPYRRPDTPRSSFRPPTPPDWPDADTPTITTDNGKTYAITPALEYLLTASQATPAAVKSLEVENPEQTAKTQTPETSSQLSAANSSQRPADLKTGFVTNPLTLYPMERREITFMATLPNDIFRGHRLWAEWTSESPEPPDPSSKLLADSSQLKALGSKSLLATQLYPSPTTFRAETLDALTFSAADNADVRATQLARPIATEEAKHAPHPTAKRWLSTPGVDIEETLTGWRITINDLPPESLRPAELELPLPADWSFPSDAALSFKYRLILPPVGSQLAGAPLSVGRPLADAQNSPTNVSDREPDSTFRPLDSSPLDENNVFDASTAPNRFEEFDVNFRDANGTLWSVWPRLFAKKETQNYLEPATNFTPMFFSRAPVRKTQSLELKADSSELIADSSPFKAKSLVILFRPRVLPTTIEIDFPRLIRLEPR